MKTKKKTVYHGQRVATAFHLSTKITWKHIARRVVENVECCKNTTDLTRKILNFE